MASASRVDVLLDQFKSLNENPKYNIDHKTKGSANAKKRLMIEHVIYKYSFEPESKVIVLVFFDDHILNKEAEDEKLKI